MSGIEKTRPGIGASEGTAVRRATDTKFRNAKPADKPFRVVDSGGLHLFVSPAGSRVWRWRYEVAGREKLLTLGSYADMSLSEARRLRDEARQQLKGGEDPGTAKRLARMTGIAARENSFEAVAKAWHKAQRPAWTERHADDVLTSLKPVFAALGAVAIRDIEAPAVLAVLREIEARPAVETARRVRQRMSAVFVFAIASGLAKQDPAAIVVGAMAKAEKTRQPAVVDLDGARTMLAAAEARPAHPVVKLANRFLALTAARPGEVRGARWDEMEDVFGKLPLWRVPAARMKMKVEHLVPLSAEAVDVLRALRDLGIRGELIFPSVRRWSKPLSENAIGYYLNRAGYHGQHVPHGWRATFSSVMNNRFAADRAAIDLMLAHAPPSSVEGVYNRALHLDRRRKLAQLWASLLLKGAVQAGELLDTARRPPSPYKGIKFTREVA